MHLLEKHGEICAKCQKMKKEGDKIVKNDVHRKWVVV